MFVSREVEEDEEMMLEGELRFVVLVVEEAEKLSLLSSAEDAGPPSPPPNANS